MKIKKGGVIYFLDRGCWNVNDPEALVKKMDIIHKPKGTFEEAGLYAHTKDGYYTIQFPVSQEKVTELTKPDYPCIFETREAALAQYNKELKAKIENIMNKPKDELLKELFREWRGEYLMDIAVHDAMVEKFKKEFNVDVKEA
jgi:hypothetical protein